MTDTARIPDDAFTPASESRPVLRAVPTPAPSPAAAEPDVGRGAVRGFVVGFLVVATAMTVIGTIGGLGFAPSLGLGVFIGAWGGGGFGFMMGGTLPLARHLDALPAPSTRRHA